MNVTQVDISSDGCGQARLIEVDGKAVGVISKRNAGRGAETPWEAFAGSRRLGVFYSEAGGKTAALAAVLASYQITDPDAGKPEKSTTQDAEKSTTQDAEKSTTQDVEKSTTQEVVKNSQCPCRTKRTPANT
jgi:hypothetical protein